MELSTPRLELRQWREEDLEPWAALNADPEVMRYFPAAMTRAQSDEWARTIRARIDLHGWGWWALEVRGGPEFIGFVGLNRPTFEAHFMPAMEIGWRLARPYWGQGYATEGASAALSFAFDELECPEVVAFAVVSNERSLAVMRRLGMTHDPADDFDHPNVPDGPLRRHALYRISAESWRAREASAPASR